ncbi:MAG: co-chaperone GroES [Bryobacteraceae bacterium]|nr:co-chaperone GroES [Bryobacteraceae bacterium]
MKLRPLHDRVLVKRIEETESKVGAIYVPDSAKEKPQQGEIVAVGEGSLMKNGERTKLEVKPGDKILFGRYSGSDVRVDGEDYLILREDEILAILA